MDLWECTPQNGCGNRVKVCIKMHTHDEGDRRELREFNPLCFAPGLIGE